MLVTEDKMNDVLLSLYEQCDELAVDTETTGLNLHLDDRMIGVSIHNPKLGSFYFPFRHEQGYNLPEYRILSLRELLTLKRLIMFNGKFDLKVFWKEGIDLFGKFQDPMLAAHLMNENEYFKNEEGQLVPGAKGIPKTTFTLEHLSKKYLGAADEKVAMDKILEETFPTVNKKERKGLMWKLDSAVVAPYAEGDVELTWALRDFYVPHLVEWKLYELWLEVSEYSSVISKMENRGMKMNVPLIEQYMKESEAMVEPALKKVQEMAGYPINLKSAPQVQAFLGVKSADKENLEILREQGNPAAQAILDFRGWSKVNNTYYEPYLRLKDADDCLHPNLSLTGTVTGRLSAFEPNMQAVPRETTTYKVKDVFIAREGYTLIEGDLSQAEVRLAAHYGKDVEMKRVIMNGLNMHDEVSRELKIDRDTAKRLNFSVIYGIGAKSLSENLKISVMQASDYLARYHKLYPGFRRLYDSANKMAERRGYIRMFTGRIRRYDRWNPSHKASSNLVQGGVGEIMRTIILRVDKELPFVHQLLTVHDSILLESPTEKVSEVCRALKTFAEAFDFDPPQKMDVKFGQSWGEMQKWPVSEVKD